MAACYPDGATLPTHVAPLLAWRFVLQLSARIHVETGHRGSNQGIVGAAGGDLVLIDAPQLPADAVAWARTVAALGTARYLVNTDHHPDHTIGNRWLPGTVVAHRGTRERLASHAPAPAYLRRLIGALDPPSLPLLDGYRVRLPELTFADRLDLWVGDRLVELHHAPGHTASTILAWVPQEGVLFTGDAVCESGLPGFSDARLPDVLAAIDRAATFPFEHLVPGHGAVGGPEVLHAFRDRVSALVAEVASARARGDDRARCAATIRYSDPIHGPSASGPGFPPDLVEAFQRASIERIFDDLEADPSLAG
jgi:cyclase